MNDMERYLIDDYKNGKYVDRLTRGGLAKYTPLIITTAITGGNHGKEANPNLPETAEEQVQQTYDAYNAGASMVHVHCRDRNNPAEMTRDVNDYINVNRMIREKCPDIIINNTCGGGRVRAQDGSVGPCMRLALDAKPEVASIDISGLVSRITRPARPGREAPRNEEFAYGITPTEADDFVDKCNELGIKPEYECFDIGDIIYLKQMIANGKAIPPYLVQFVLHPGTNFPSIEYLLNAIQWMPENTVMGTIGIGSCQFPMLAAAIVLGTHVRVGMEDNIYLEKGKLADSNAQLVEKIVRLAKELGRPIATPAQARQMLGLGAPKQY